MKEEAHCRGRGSGHSWRVGSGRHRDAGLGNSPLDARWECHVELKDETSPAEKLLEEDGLSSEKIILTAKYTKAIHLFINFSDVVMAMHLFCFCG